MPMNPEDLARFAEDLQTVAGLKVEFLPASYPNGMHVIRIGDADFFFTAKGYDGWGASLSTTADADHSAGDN